MPRKKKLHWTQTPEGRKKVLRNLVKANKAVAAKYRQKKILAEVLQSDNFQKESASGEAIENHVSYLWGKIETIIEHYCDSAGISRSAVTGALAGILQSKTSR